MGLIPPVTLDLFYLGSRDYVNGLTLFEEMLKAYMNASGRRPNFINKFQVTKWVRTDATLEVWSREQLRGNKRARQAAVRMDITCAAESPTLLLFALDNKPVDSRLEEYDRQAYVAHAQQTEDDGTRAKLARIDNVFDLVRGVVEVNHQYVVGEAAKLDIHKGVSWAYLNKFPFPTDEAARTVLEIQYGRPTAFDAYGNRYIVRPLTMLGVEAPGEAEMCFFFPLSASSGND